MTNNLEQIWLNISWMGGWLAILKLTGVYTEEELEKLEEIDDCYLDWIRKARLENNNKYDDWLEIPRDEKRAMRMEYLKNQIKKLTELKTRIWLNYQKQTEIDLPYWLRSALLELEKPKEIEKQLNYYRAELRILEENKELKNDISEIEINKALNVPFSKLLEFNQNNFALCPFHEEKTPSLHWIKETNLIYCFGCQYCANTIKFLMKKENLTFKEAINKLNNL